MNKLSPDTFSSKLSQLGQRIDQLIQEVDQFYGANSKCFSCPPEGDLLQLAEMARLFSEKIDGFLSKRDEIEQEATQIRTFLEDVSKNPLLSSKYAREIEVHLETAKTIATKALILFLNLDESARQG